MIGLNFYGLSLALAIFVAFGLTAFRAKNRGLDPDVVWKSLPWVLVGGIIGARLYHVLNFLPFYLDHWQLIPQVWLGGLGIFGGLLGGTIGILIFEKFRRAHSSSSTTLLHSNVVNGGGGLGGYLDAAASIIPLAQAIGRVGNIFNGENLPFAYWEIIANISIMILLFSIEKFVDSKSQITNLKWFDKLTIPSEVEGQNSNLKFLIREGYLFFIYLVSYSMTRFFLEFFRTDSPWIFGPLTVAQWVSLTIFGFVIVGSRRFDRKQPLV